MAKKVPQKYCHGGHGHGHGGGGYGHGGHGGHGGYGHRRADAENNSTETQGQPEGQAEPTLASPIPVAYGHAGYGKVVPSDVSGTHDPVSNYVEQETGDEASDAINAAIVAENGQVGGNVASLPSQIHLNRP